MTGIQALLFDRNYFTKQEVRRFIEKNNLHPVKQIHTTDTYYRVRLISPDYKHHYYRFGHIVKGLNCIFEFDY